MGISNITPEEAKRRMDAADGFVFVDVRTPAEFAQGHIPGATNIPVATVNAATSKMELESGFVSAIQAKFGRDTRLIVNCKSGGRSMTACQLLAEAGYSDLSNLAGGFGGVADPSGQIIREGWSTLGYPVERGLVGSNK